MRPRTEEFEGLSVLVTADFEEVSAPTNSEVGTPSFDAAPEVTPSEQPENETPDTGAEESESAEQAPRPEPSTLEELNELYRQAKLNDPALVQKREELLQREWQSKQDTQRRLAEMQAADRQRQEAAINADKALQAELAANRQREIDRAAQRGEAPDLDLIEERNQASLANYKARMAEIVLEPIKGGLREALLSIYGDTPQNRHAANSRDVHDLISDIYGAAYELGRKAGPGDDHVVIPKKDYDKAIAAARKAGIDEIKAANPTFKDADTGTSRRSAPSGPGDLAGFEAKLAKEGLTESEWQSYEAARRAAGLD